MTPAPPGGWLDLPAGDPFGLHNLPYGCGALAAGGPAVALVRVGAHVLDLTASTERLLPDQAALFAAGTLDAFLAAGPATWRQVRAAVRAWLTDTATRTQVQGCLAPVDSAVLRLPFAVADYVDFYSSEQHATNIGRIFRPGAEPLTPNWKHLPIGYHGRAGTVVASATAVTRPSGQSRTAGGDIVFGPSERLDIEAELGFVVGVASTRGTPVPLTAFGEHVFGVCLLNDWSARDLQAWESVPLGPFLGKSFATSISPWIVPLDALHAARVRPPERDPRPLPYLDDTDTEPWGLDVTVEVRLNGQLISTPPFRTMYWTAAQQLAHLTVNGASLRTGDLFGSGTISGPEPGQRGSLIELTWNGSEPLHLPDGTTRTFLEDGDEVVISAQAAGEAGATVGFGEVRGVVTAG